MEEKGYELKCPHCDKDYSDRTDVKPYILKKRIRAHMKNVHKPREKVNVTLHCPNCGKHMMTLIC